MKHFVQKHDRKHAVEHAAVCLTKLDTIHMKMKLYSKAFSTVLGIVTNPLADLRYVLAKMTVYLWVLAIQFGDDVMVFAKASEQAVRDYFS